MLSKGIRRGLSLLLVLCFLAVGITPFVAKADEISELKASIQKKQEAISEAESLKKELQSGLTDVKNIISSLETSKKNLATYVKELDQTLTKAQTRIMELNDMITQKEAELVQTKQELEDAIADEETQYDAMMERIHYTYEHGSTMYLEILFSAASFADLLNQADYVNRLMAYDTNTLELYRQTREYVEVCKQQLESEQELLEEARVEVKKEEAALETLISEKEKEITAYEADISNQEAALAELEAEIQAQNEEIEALEQAVAAEKKALDEAQRRKYDGGVFAWPAPSYTRISDDYGYRMHPTLHVRKFHNGIDLAAPGGSPILAAYHGEVVAAAYSSTMGNYVMIDHGDNLFTIYMHASKLYVKKGQEVTRGEKIAAVGTTGRSTGNHLHFGVRLNGSYVSPWNYLSK